jgi:arsenite methyltransferase
METDPMHDEVKKYYGEVLKDSRDLKTNACCTVEPLPSHVREILSRIHEEVTARYYGCGLVIPQQIEGLRVLDLGCGAGRDCYLLSALVGAEGTVVGVDMTEAQLAVAQRHVEYHAHEFGYNRPNVHFLQGELERLHELDLPDGSFDLIVSNCVLNLCVDKAAVLKQAYRLLKAGGEMYFSDVYADRRIPAQLASNPVLYGECLGGALYWNDFLSLAKQAGFLDPRLAKDNPITVQNPDLAAEVGAIRFYSATYRLFKLNALEPACEDYGQAVIYRGTVPHYAQRFVLDKHHDIETGRVFKVCGNTWRMLHDTRFASHFEFIGDFSRHFGLFEGCGGGLPFDRESASNGSSACC